MVPVALRRTGRETDDVSDSHVARCVGEWLPQRGAEVAPCAVGSKMRDIHKI